MVEAVIVAVDDYLKLWLSSALAFLPASSQGRVALVQNLPLRTEAQALLLLFAPLHPDLFACFLMRPSLMAAELSPQWKAPRPWLSRLSSGSRCHHHSPPRNRLQLSVRASSYTGTRGLGCAADSPSSFSSLGSPPPSRPPPSSSSPPPLPLLLPAASSGRGSP